MFLRAIALTLFVAALVHAASVTLSPVAQNVDIGSEAVIDIVISDVQPPSISAFAFVVTYDPTLLAISDAGFSPVLGSPIGSSPLCPEGVVFACSAWDGSVPGVVQLLNITQITNPADLTAIQSPTMTLATIRFTAVAQGTSKLSLILALVADESSAQVPVTTTEAQINIGSTVPEPAAFYPVALVLVGLIHRKVRL